MDFTDYMIWKAIAIGAVVFLVNVWMGFTGRPLWEPLYNPTPEVLDAQPQNQRQALEVLERLDEPAKKLPAKG